MKGRILEGFGARLARLRKAAGLTQTQLGDKVGLSKRMVAYYESTEAQPPGPLLPDLARALGVSLDQLLGMKAVRDTVSPRTARLVNRLRRIEELPPKDQKQILDHLDALIERNRNGRRRARRARAAVGS
jgi:transcriptional regulator with XRE-family HTH domain